MNGATPTASAMSSALWRPKTESPADLRSAPSDKSERRLPLRAGWRIIRGMAVHPESKPTGRRAGQGMLIVAFALGLAALTGVFNEWLERQANPNRSLQGLVAPDGAREVVLERNRQGHYVASGEINGLPVIFLLDTGATEVAIPDHVARAAGLRRGHPGRAATANGTVTVYATQIDELLIGNILLRDLSASITPSMGGDTILLGMSALQRIDFSQSGTRLTLRQPAATIPREAPQPI